MKVLTREQSDIVAMNHKLVGRYLTDKGLSDYDWYATVTESLIKAVRNHDARRGELSTLFYSIAKNDVAYIRRKLAAKIEREKVDIESGDGFVINLLGIANSAEKTIGGEHMCSVLDSHIAMYLSNLEGESKQIMSYLSAGYNSREIAEKLGMSRSSVVNRVKKLRLEVGEILCLY